MNGKIVIAEDEPITRMNIAEMISEKGYNVVGEAADGFDAVELCKNKRPDLAILDVKMPILDGLNAAKIIISKGYAKSVILLTAYSSKEFVEKAKEVGVMNYLVKPLTEEVVLPAVELAIHNANMISDYKEEAQKMQEKIDTRIAIERAKGILIKKYSYSEEEAFQYIRKLSMDKRGTMKEMAQIIILSNEMEG